MATFSPVGTGNAVPEFLQGRTPVARPVTQPILPPRRPGIFGGVQQAQQARRLSIPVVPRPTAPQITPASPGPAVPKPPAPAQTLFEFFKGDLERQRKAALADAQADAARRGVFFGTPLTTSQGDIQTEFLRGLGSLQAGILQNEQQNELQRIALASGLLGQQGEAQAGGISPEVMQTIGALFAPRQGPTAPAITGPAAVQPELEKRGGRLVVPRQN